jgi:atypical dual specificity phosphatase
MSSQLDVLSFTSEPVGGHPIRCANLIIPRLYLSDLSTARKETTTRNLGITHIVSVIGNAPTFPESMAHVQKLHIKSNDSSEDNLLQHMPTTTSFIRTALDEKPDNVVLVCSSTPLLY